MVDGSDAKRPQQNWRWLLPNAILFIHDEALEEHGGSPGIRDMGVVESALSRPVNLANYGPTPPASPSLTPSESPRITVSSMPTCVRPFRPPASFSPTMAMEWNTKKAMRSGSWKMSRATARAKPNWHRGSARDRGSAERHRPNDMRSVGGPPKPICPACARNRRYGRPSATLARFAVSCPYPPAFWNADVAESRPGGGGSLRPSRAKLRRIRIPSRIKPSPERFPDEFERRPTSSLASLAVFGRLFGH